MRAANVEYSLSSADCLSARLFRVCSRCDNQPEPARSGKYAHGKLLAPCEEYHTVAEGGWERGPMGIGEPNCSV